MRPQVSSDSDQIAVLSFIATFKDAWNFNRIPKAIAVRCFQCCLEGHEEPLLVTLLKRSSIAVDSKRSEMFRIYEDMVSLLLQTYATDEVIAKAYNDVVNFLQSFATSKAMYSRMLWNKAFHCGTVFSDRLLEFVFIDEVPPGTRAQTRHLLSINPRSDYHTKARQA